MTHAQTTPARAPAQDPISHDFRQIPDHGPEMRRLTVSYGAQIIRESEGRQVLAPMLRLMDAWLKRARFAIGVPVTVRVSSGRLDIEVVELERVPAAEVLATIERVADGGLPKRDVDAFVRHLKRRRTD